jgi:ubiquinone/menaquinone biosynthesis C-methylase UbiE
MADDPLYDDARLARFYDLDVEWGADRDFCLDLARNAESVLDLGCGTGALALRIAAETGAEVTALEPAAAMLDIARSRDGAERVDWVQGDARSVDLGRHYELILMTGHTFQVFLTTDDRARCLATIARHLVPDGRFIFDSRNPAVREWEEWRPDLSGREFDDPEFGRIEAWNDVHWDTARGIVTYETVYRACAGGPEYRAASRIGFPSLDELTLLITEAGLEVERWLGDWSGAELDHDSPAFIPYGRRVSSPA